MSDTVLVPSCHAERSEASDGWLRLFASLRVTNCLRRVQTVEAHVLLRQVGAPGCRLLLAEAQVHPKAHLQRLEVRLRGPCRQRLPRALLAETQLVAIAVHQPQAGLRLLHAAAGVAH